MLSVLAHGMSDLASGCYIPVIGWVGANDPREIYGEAQEHLMKLLDDHKVNREKVHAERFRTRALLAKNKMLATINLQMTEAVLNRDFVKCIQIAISGTHSLTHSLTYSLAYTTYLLTHLLRCVFY